jgi:hypothetical protein
MAFRLTDDEEKRYEELKDELYGAYDSIEGAVYDYNEAEKELREPIEDTLTDYNKALSNLRDFVKKTAFEKRGEYESGDLPENASAVDAWIREWEDADLDEVEIKYPEETLEVNFDNHADIDLPTEP